MSEGTPIPPQGGEANQGAGSIPSEQPGPEENQRLDPHELTAELEKAGHHTLAEYMRRPTPSDEEIRQRHHQENEAWVAEMDAK